VLGGITIEGAGTKESGCLCCLLKREEEVREKRKREKKKERKKEKEKEKERVSRRKRVANYPFGRRDRYWKRRKGKAERGESLYVRKQTQGNHIVAGMSTRHNRTHSKNKRKQHNAAQNMIKYRDQSDD